MRYFNTAGPINPEKHYYVPRRLNEIELNQLIQQEKYFILHAPRQSGKTTAMRLFVDELNATQNYIALYINVEPSQVARGNVEKGLLGIINIIRIELSRLLPSHPVLAFFDSINLAAISVSSLYECLSYVSSGLDKPFIFFIDEIDSLVGDTLLSVLRQLRAGYPNRPHAFPQSICLIGVRDVRDYRIWSDEDKSMVFGGSAFNIKAESLTLSNFSLEQTRVLYLQHSQETGQQFTDESIEYAHYLTQGQPWLVNALAYQACFKDVIDRAQPITKDVIERAKETLILRRDTHIDQLVHKLEEPRVRTIIDAILSGTGQEETFKIDDLQYVRDLGLVTQRGIKIANPIYQEVIPRELVYTEQESMKETVADSKWYQNEDGSLNMYKVLESFTQFYRENSEIWLGKFDYKEAGPHLLLMAFLQRIVNGGGKIHREYALGRKRVDLLITFPCSAVAGAPCDIPNFRYSSIGAPIQRVTKDGVESKGVERIVVELKVKRNEKTLADGLVQTIEYMDINNATEGHLVIFDPKPNLTWDEKIFRRQETIGTYTVNVWGM